MAVAFGLTVAVIDTAALRAGGALVEVKAAALQGGAEVRVRHSDAGGARVGWAACTVSMRTVSLNSQPAAQDLPSCISTAQLDSAVVDIAISEAVRAPVVRLCGCVHAVLTILLPQGDMVAAATADGLVHVMRVQRNAIVRPPALQRLAVPRDAPC